VGGEYRNNVLLRGAGKKGRLWELNARCGVAKKEGKFGDTKEIWQSLGIMVRDYVRRIKYTRALMRVRIPVVAMTQNKHKLFLNCICVLTLTILHGKRMNRNILCVSGTCQAVQYYSYLINNVWSLKYVLFYSLQLLSQIFPILRPIRHYVVNVSRLSCKVPIILFECKWHLNILDGFSKHRLI